MNNAILTTIVLASAVSVCNASHTTPTTKPTPTQTPSLIAPHGKPVVRYKIFAAGLGLGKAPRIINSTQDGDIRVHSVLEKIGNNNVRVTTTTYAANGKQTDNDHHFTEHPVAKWNTNMDAIKKNTNALRDNLFGQDVIPNDDVTTAAYFPELDRLVVSTKDSISMYATGNQRARN